MKSVFFGLLFSMMALSAFAQSEPVYTLQQICTKYGNFNQCSTVPFCKETVYPRGCYKVPGQPDYVANLCKMQTTESGCNIMSGAGMCAWNSQAVSYCDAKIKSL